MQAQDAEQKIRYSQSYLEAALQVDETRKAIARAHAARMMIEDRAKRIAAKLSEFLPVDACAKAWFIHEKAQIPVCYGWPVEKHFGPTHHVESRTCINDALCTPWYPLPEVESCTAGALCDYLRKLQGREPVLHPVGFSQRMVEDADGVQYRFVSIPPLRIPSPDDLAKMLYAVAGVA